MKSADGRQPHYTPKELAEPILFLAPLLLFILIFVLVPVIGTVINSFFRDITFLPAKFIFLDNFSQLMRDAQFWASLRFTLLFSLISVPLEVVAGLLFAVLLNEPLRWRGVIRAAVLIPWAIPTAISARVWELIYNYNYGLANYICKKIGVSVEPINWLGSSWGAFWALVCADVWKTAPFVAIILLAGLAVIPPQLYRQAKIDGAHFGQRFFKVTLPILKPVLLVALLFRTIDALRVFDLIYVLTHGGPGGSTTSVSIYGYNYFLGGDFGYGSAVAVVLFAVSFVLSVMYVKAGRFNEGVL